ncbi:hypothetical protein J5N97_024512 [Dioscorea zingiberensis]|uniref:CCHC-type domain-containing protein n=1 Tax=Dioscorea zingiberensis TaxID=325984 RepID=A0A9D5C735_9LILI|nr:hypothetical protein J5N97_024512 [Dioscorea zingiberensis]
MKRTPSGVIEVCGKCRQPGHMMVNCRRMEVCRRCEKPGHKALRCPVPSSELGTIQLQGAERTRAKGKRDDLATLTTLAIRQHQEGEPSRKKGKKKKEPGMGGTGEQLGSQKEATTTPSHGKTPVTEGSHNVSAAADDILVEEVRRLRRYVVVTVVKGFAGLRPHAKVKEEIAALMAPELNWEVQPFEDEKEDKILLRCPSEELAKKIISRKDLTFQGFTVQCAPCTAATNATGKAEGELRWITAKGLPIYCQRRDTLARMLKPVGDLVYMGSGGAFFAGHCRAAVRIRRGRKLPTILNYSAFTEKFTIRIQLDRGEPPLPWINRRRRRRCWKTWGAELKKPAPRRRKDPPDNQGMTVGPRRTRQLTRQGTLIP